MKNSDQQSLDDVNTKINGLLSEGVSVPGTSIVILSYNTLDFTRQCLESIKNTISLDRCQVIVVDNASEDGSVDYLRSLDWITLVEKHENRGFPGGCNDGIATALPDNDIYLLNSDTILLPNSLFWLKMGLYESEKVGSTGSMSNYAAGNQMIKKDWKSVDDIIEYGTNLNMPMEYPYEYRMFLIGFSLLLKRNVLDEIGLLDERFNPGNSEDLDICFRLLKSGRVNLLCRNSFVVHFGSKSFAQLQKKGQNYTDLLSLNNKKLLDKMGFDPWQALNDTKSVALSQIREKKERPVRILELGCGMGNTASLIKTVFPNAEFTGVEEDGLKAAYAQAFGNIVNCSVEKADRSESLKKNYFDYIIYSAKHDEVITKKFTPFLRTGGKLINNTGKPVLSISMLCNGKHKEETKKCLQSLMTIKNRLASELIVVDTGCDDEMHDLLGQYADKIVPFKWCDDFAKARNAGLKECTGEWFMYVDDDEWFENTDELVAFFTSGEYRQYKQAAYIVRNYLNADGTEYDDFWAGRMTVLTSKTHFEGEIHEYLAPLEGECKMIHSFEHHYGYVYKDKKDHYAKAVRNIKPLINMINKDPGNLHWYSQLIQEYLAIGDAGRLSDLCDRLIKESDKIDDPEMNWARADFYNGKLWADNHLYQYDQTISDFNSFRKDHRNDEICNASLYFNAISAFYELKDYDNAERYCKKYMQIYEKWQKYDDFDERVNEGSLTTRYIFRERYLWPVISILIETGLKRDDPAELDQYFDKLSSMKNGGKQYDLVYEQIIEFFARAEYQDRYVSYADRMLSYVDSFQKCTEYLIELGKKDKREHTGTTEKLIKVFGQTKNGRNYYLDFLRVRYEAEYGTDRDALLDKYKSLVFMTNDFLNLDASIWQIAKDKDIDLGAIFKQIPLKKWYRVVDEYFSKHTDEQTKKVRELMSTLSDDEDIRFRFFRLKQKETEIAHEKNAASAAEKLSAYCDECIGFYKEIYAEDQFTADESASMLPAECEFAVKFKRAAEISDPSRKEAKLSECGKVFAPFTSALKEYLKKEAAGRQTFIFIIYKAEQMNALESLFDACDADTQSRAIVLPIPYYDKKPDGTLGEYHFEKDAIPEKYHTAYFADTDLEKMHPDVIFISAQMDGGNPKAAVPAEFYADVLKKYTRMLVYVPEEVIEKPGMGEKVFGQVKEQLKRQ
ncbi:MAG: glycosyltransferase [Lachnospiraceae bacterium]|nr:glycosyltransferase [Lachnospiraceae bacterium]